MLTPETEQRYNELLKVYEDEGCADPRSTLDLFIQELIKAGRTRQQAIFYIYELKKEKLKRKLMKENRWKIQPKDIGLSLGFTFLYIFLVFISGLISRILYEVFNMSVLLYLPFVLVPLSIAFGWPVIVGITAGSFAVCFYLSWGGNLSFLEIPVFIFAQVLASALAWKVGRSKTSVIVNVMAIVGVLVAVVALVIPWWSFNAEIAQISGDFTVYPGWFGGNVGIFADVLLRIFGLIVDIDLFGQVVGSLRNTSLLVGFGSLAALVGAFLRGLKGRIAMAVGVALCAIGIFNFYNSLNQSVVSLRIPVSGSVSFPLVQATWGWTYGMYLSIIAVVILVIAVAVHSHMPEMESNRFLGCTSATIAMLGFGVLDTIIFSLLYNHPLSEDTLGSWVSSALVLFFTINIIGYGIIARREEEE